MTPKDYLRQYIESFQPPETESSLPPDGSDLMLERGYYYPPYLKDELYLDVQSRSDLLEIVQEILGDEAAGQRLARRHVIAHLELLRSLRRELAWRHQEIERLGRELADREALIARQTIEMERYQAALARHENDNTILRANLADLRQSTSWKVTAPLRRLSLAVKALRTHAGKLRRF